MARTKNEQRLLDIAGHIDETATMFREGFENLKSEVDSLKQKAQDATAHGIVTEAENLDDEFATLESSVAGMEQLAGQFRMAATQGGDVSKVDVTAIQPAEPPAGTGAGQDPTTSSAGSGTDATLTGPQAGTSTTQGGGASPNYLPTGTGGSGDATSPGNTTDGGGGVTPIAPNPSGDGEEGEGQ